MKTFKNIAHFFIKIASKIPYFSFFIGLIAIAVFSASLYYVKQTFLDTSFIVQASNFDTNYKKIPADIGYIDFTLSKDINPKSIDPKSMIISPKLEGQIKLISGNTLRYIFLAPLKVGQNLNISLGPDIESRDGEKLGSYNYDIIVSEQARVTRITPSGKIENLGQNIAVFFNVPMVALSDISSREDFPCPLKIEPNIDGTCKWTTSSVLEFIPKTSLKGATKYSVTLQNTDKLLYPFQTGSGVIIQTPYLEPVSSQNFRASDGIDIRFNFPVNIDALKASLELKQESDGKRTTKSFEIIPSKESESVFTLLLSGEQFSYDTSYELTVKKGLFPKYGNIPLEKEWKQIVRSYPFLRSVNVYRNIFSNTGVLIDTRSFSQGDKLPVKNVMFHLDFEEEIPNLDSSNFIFQGPSGPVAYDISYRDEEIYNFDGTKKIQKNKKQIALILKSDLLSSQPYALILKKEISKNLTTDIVSSFTTADALQVTKLDFVDYKKYCLYTNNTLSFTDAIKTTLPNIVPAARVMSVDAYQWLPFDVQNLTGSTLKEKGYCPERVGETMTIINPRLSPDTNYTLGIRAGIEDIYGNILLNPVSMNIKTGEIKTEDKYLYTSATKDINFIPSYLPLNVNLQSINMTGAKLDVCELDEKGLMDYRTNGYNANFILRCKNKYIKEVALKNHLWNISHNVFDLEKDIVGKPLNEKYILVRGYKDKEKSFTSLYIRGNINMTFEAAANKNLLFVSDFSGNPIKEPLSLVFYRFDERTQSFKIINPKYTVSKDGLVYEIEPSDIRYIFAKNSQYSGVLDISNDGLSNDDFGYIGGVSSYDKNYAYIYTERPIYKPGDTVYLKGIVRTFDFDGYKKIKSGSGTLDILDKDLNIIYTSQVSIDTNSNFLASFILPAEVTLGEFRVRFVFDQNEFMNNASFYVEEYRKPDFKIEAESYQKDIRFGETFTATLFPKYYFGGSILETKGKYSLLTQNYFFDAKNFSDYQFGEGYTYFDCIYWGACSYADNLSGVQDFEINQGKYDFSYTLPKESEGEKIYSFNFDIEDPNTKKNVSKTLSVVAHTTDAYVGLQTNYWNTPKTGIQATAITLDYEAKPLPNKKIKTTLIKRDWKSVKKQGVDGIFYQDYALEEKEEAQTSLTTDAFGKAKIFFSPQNTGEYMLKVSYTGSNGKTFTSSSILFVSGQEYTVWNNGNNDITELVSVKPQVNVGENAEYVLKSPINTGKALIVLIKDEGILDYRVHTITSYGDKITIPVKDSYYPNYYIKAFLVGTQQKNPLPIYKRALTITKVNTEYKHLKVTIVPQKNSYTPREKVKLTIRVTDSQGKPVPNANGSISLVDQSLLALKGNPQKNPYAFFYDMRRYLGTYTTSLYKNLVEKLEIKDTSNGQKGGAGDQIKGGDSKKARGLFKDTAFWQSDFTTDINGTANIVTSELPDNLTTWVIESIVATPENTRVGVGYETIMTTKSVLIQDNLPNFVASNDTITLSPVIFNKTGISGEFDISLSGKNFTQISKKIPKIFIENGDSKVVPIQVKISDTALLDDKKTPFVTFQIEAILKANNQSDTIIKHLEIKENSVRETTSTIGKTRGTAFDEKIDISATQRGLPVLKLSYGSSLFSSVTESIDYLADYPYGCSEQKTSAVLPNIVLKNLYESLGQPFDFKTKMIKYFDSETGKEKQKSLDQVIQEYLTNIRKYQKNDGGFVYWYDMGNDYPNYSDFSLSSYLLKANAQIRDAGYKLDDDTFKKLEKYLKTKFYKNQKEECIATQYDDCRYDEIHRLESIEAILTYKKNDYEAYKMYTLLDFKNPSVSTLLKQARVISLLKDIPTLLPTQKEKLISQGKNILQTVQNNELVFNPRGAYIGRSTQYSRIQNTALFLENIALFGPENFTDQEALVDNLQRWILSQKRDANFGSTQDTLFALQSIAIYLATTGDAKNTYFQANISLNTKPIATKIFTSKNFLDTYTRTFSGSELASKNTLNFTLKGTGTLYYDMNLGYSLSSELISARDEGFALHTQYYDFEGYKKIESLKKAEWQKYLSGSLSSDELKYPKNIFEYLAPLSEGKVGQLVIVHSQIITSETRDKVAFESFIPSGSEIVNPNLDTSSKTAFEFMDTPFQKIEYRTDRFFGYSTVLEPGIHSVSYLLRFTHSGMFGIKPTQAYEFYQTEVFGRTAGKIWNIR